MSTSSDSDEIFLDGVRYISAVHAAREFGITNDYITSFCRQGKVDARRVGKSWYVRRDGLKDFLAARTQELSTRRTEIARARAEEYRQQQWLRDHVSEAVPESAEKYISAVEASKEFGVTNDYVTQWCRSGKLPCKRIGKNWYVRYESLRSLLVESEYAQSVRKTELANNRAKEYRKLHTAHPLFSTSAFLTAERRQMPLPTYALTPITELLHKVTALALALMLTFGTYAAVDPSYARFAADSVRENVGSVLASYRGLDALAARTQSQVALVAENPERADRKSVG